MDTIKNLKQDLQTVHDNNLAWCLRCHFKVDDLYFCVNETVLVDDNGEWKIVHWRGPLVIQNVYYQREQ